MCLLELLYIWEFTRSLGLICIGIQTLIRVLYIQFQIIFHSVGLSKSNDIAISLALRVINKRGIIYLLIRFGGIKLSL
jgi:hypothetical protein